MLNLMISFFLITSTCFGISIGKTPTTLIRGGDSSELDRPEGVAFTPSGNYVAVANSLANTITFYNQIDVGIYENTVSFSISGATSQLDYPHDLSFSPDGNHLAVANRHGNTITIYKKNGFDNTYDSIPFAIITGEASQIMGPDAVTYSPVENIIAVANKYTNSLTFYHYQKDKYEQVPYQVIQNAFLKVPDGLAFSRDGALLAVTSHDFHAAVIFQRMNDSQDHYFDHPLQVLQGEEAQLCYPHSLAFHPLKNDLAISCSQGRKNLQLFVKESETAYSNSPELSLEILDMYDASTIALIEHLQEEGGVKGIAFAPDGKSLAITQNLCHDSLQLPEPVGVVAIYPVLMDP